MSSALASNRAAERTARECRPVSRAGPPCVLRGRGRGLHLPIKIPGPSAWQRLFLMPRPPPSSQLCAVGHGGGGTATELLFWDRPWRTEAKRGIK